MKQKIKRKNTGRVAAISIRVDPSEEEAREAESRLILGGKNMSAKDGLSFARATMLTPLP
jgi:hypothetical protein